MEYLIKEYISFLKSELDLNRLSIFKEVKSLKLDFSNQTGEKI